MQLSVQRYMRQQELVITVPAAPGEADRPVTNGGATGGAVTNGAGGVAVPEQLAKDGPLFDKLIEDVRVASETGDSAQQFRRRAVRKREHRGAVGDRATVAHPVGDPPVGLTTTAPHGHHQLLLAHVALHRELHKVTEIDRTSKLSRPARQSRAPEPGSR